MLRGREWWYYRYLRPQLQNEVFLLNVLEHFLVSSWKGLTKRFQAYMLACISPSSWCPCFYSLVWILKGIWILGGGDYISFTNEILQRKFPEWWSLCHTQVLNLRCYMKGLPWCKTYVGSIHLKGRFWFFYVRQEVSLLLDL